MGENAVTPSSGFLLTPSNSNYDFKKRPDDAFLAKFSDRKAAIDAKETSRPASPAHTKHLGGGSIGNEHCTNENKLKHALSSQPLISGFMEKSDIKWDGERPGVGKKKNKRSLLADAASGIFRGGTSSGRNIDSSFSASNSSTSTSNSSSPSYFNGFANRKNNKFFHQYRNKKSYFNELHQKGISRSLTALKSSSHKKYKGDRAFKNAPSNSDPTVAWRREKELKMPVTVSPFNLDNVVERSEFIFPYNKDASTSSAGSSIKSYAHNLSLEQKRAVVAPLKQPAIITAGPGSGKHEL